MKLVKGSMILPMVKSIRANKSGIYEDLITEEDKKIISEKIYESVWYPFETYKNCLNAVAKVDAKGNMEIVKQWGNHSAVRTVGKIFNSSFARRGLEISLVLYNRFFKLWFNFGNQVAKIISENEANVIIEDFDPDFEVFYQTARGWIETSFNLFIEKKITTKFIAKSWEGAKKTIIHITVSHT